MDRLDVRRYAGHRGFLLFLAFGVNPWLSAVGAIAVTFCSYNMQIVQVGHNTKMVAIAFMPWVLAALVYAYRRKALLGAVFFALALSFQIKANHPQITYYLAFIVFGYALLQNSAERLLLREDGRRLSGMQFLYPTAF